MRISTTTSDGRVLERSVLPWKMDRLQVKFSSDGKTVTIVGKR